MFQHAWQEGHVQVWHHFINKNKVGDKYLRPNLGAVVMRHPRVSIAGRNKSNLPIFFNAIPPIEMSRCVPYIEIQVVTQDFGVNSDKMADLNHIKTMRFTETNGMFSFLNEGAKFGEGFQNVTPSNVDRDNLFGVFKEKETTNYTFMDMFASPQTMVNANINREGIDKLNINKVNMDPVLEPIAPVMSLTSLNVNITGAGFGLMASKKGNLKLILHDRSRLRDIAPLVSSTQFATTKIIVEFGWSHPEGGILSDNVIAKYINGLKERSVYQVVGTNYSFGTKNSVNIDIELAAYGYRQNERIHCGAGPEVPLNIIEDYIKKATNEIIKVKDEDKNFIYSPEVRQEVKLNSRNARSSSTMISWAAYEIIANTLKNANLGEKVDRDNLVGAIKAILMGEGETKLFSGDTFYLGGRKNEIEAAEREVESALSSMIGKLSDIKHSFSDDPMSESTVSGANVEIKAGKQGLSRSPAFNNAGSKP